MVMNVSMLVSSFKHLCTFESVVSLSLWVYQELSKIKYSDEKLRKQFQKDDSGILEAILQLNEDKSILNHLLTICFNIMTATKLRLILKYGADIHYDNDYALRTACYTGRIDLAKILIDFGADVNADNYKALRSAALFDTKDVVNILLDHGTDLDKAIDYAYECGDVYIHKQLIMYRR